MLNKNLKLNQENIEKIKSKAKKTLAENTLNQLRERIGATNSSSKTKADQVADREADLEFIIEEDSLDESDFKPENEDGLSSEVFRELELLIEGPQPSTPYRLNVVTNDQETIKRKALEKIYKDFPILLFIPPPLKTSDNLT